jgi:hypothetical protein
MTMRRVKTLASIGTFTVCTVLILAACSGNNKAPDNGSVAASDEITLPKPEATGGSITGMPDRPGPSLAGASAGSLAATRPSDATMANDGNVVAPSADGNMPGDGLAPPGTETTANLSLAEEPTPQDAVAVVRDYYAAIDDHNYAHAWALWSDGGRTSGQTPQQFADGFANTSKVAVQIDVPGRMDAAAGSRYIEVPVAIDATQRDGSVRSYSGSYTMRRAAVDGATADQRAWRIASAKLHEVNQ